MILILSPHNDEHVPYVTARLETLGAEYFRFDAADFPGKSEVRVGFGSTGLASRTLRYNGQELDLDSVTAVWNRARTSPQAAEEVRQENKWWVSEVSTSWLAEVWESLNCLWIPDRPRTDREPYRKRSEPNNGQRLGSPPASAGPSPYSKLNQLAVAARLGFRVPRTLVTNSPEGLIEFYEDCKGQVVTKTVLPLRISRDGELNVPYTQVMRRQHLAHYRAVRYAPITIQEYVPKRLELRVTVVGSDVFAAAIDSQANRATRDDWRRESDGNRCLSYYAPYSLPVPIEKLCVRLVQALGLCFGAIDIVLTPEGEYVFLEVNPNGQWSWIQDVTGLPIAEAIANLLIRGAVLPLGTDADATHV
jgi:RimK-like ATP-grasp domain